VFKVIENQNGVGLFKDVGISQLQQQNPRGTGEQSILNPLEID